MPQLRHSHTDGMPIACLTSPLHHPISAPFQPQPATAMTTLLIQNATCIATFDHADPRLGTELRNASLFIRDHRIAWVGPAAELPPALAAEHAEAVTTGRGETLNAKGHLVTPGLVNTHHHMYQSLTRAIPQVQDAELFGWLRGLYPIWAGLTPEMVFVSTQTAMAEQQHLAIKFFAIACHQRPLARLPQIAG